MYINQNRILDNIAYLKWACNRKRLPSPRRVKLGVVNCVYQKPGRVYCVEKLPFHECLRAPFFVSCIWATNLQSRPITWEGNSILTPLNSHPLYAENLKTESHRFRNPELYQSGIQDFDFWANRMICREYDKDEGSRNLLRMQDIWRDEKTRVRGAHCF